MNYRELYEEGVKELLWDEDAKLDARLLLEEVCGTDLQTLLVYPETKITPEQEDRYRKLIARRCAREPVAMILQRADFMGLTFRVTGDVLIPRQDTEILAELAVKALKDKLAGGGDADFLDLCTGSGCILISAVYHALAGAPAGAGSHIHAVGTDISAASLKVAAGNETVLQDNSGSSTDRAHISWLEGDLFEALEKNEGAHPSRFDIIVSNPPYIPTDVIGTLEPEVRDKEPARALDGGADGLVFYRRIAAGIRQYLKKNGIIILEIGYDQAASVSAVFEQAGFGSIELYRDYGGNDRVLVIKCRE